MSLFKVIDPIQCPCCNKTIFLSCNSGITLVSTKEDLATAKNKILQELEKINFPSEDYKQEILAMINSDTCLRDLSDVEETIKQIQVDVINKTKEIENQ